MEPQPNNDRNSSTPVPRWLTVGAWVTPRCGMIPLRVEEIYSDGIVSVKNDSGETFIGCPSQFRPICFRYPTLQEAYGWLGKVMDKGNGRREIVCIVDEDEVTGSEDDALNGKMLFVNACPAECLQGYSIDGHPFGVPEVTPTRRRSCAVRWKVTT